MFLIAYCLNPLWLYFSLHLACHFPTMRSKTTEEVIGIPRTYRRVLVPPPKPSYEQLEARLKSVERQRNSLQRQVNKMMEDERS